MLHHVFLGKCNLMTPTNNNKLAINDYSVKDVLLDWKRHRGKKKACHHMAIGSRDKILQGHMNMKNHIYIYIYIYNIITICSYCEVELGPMPFPNAMNTWPRGPPKWQPRAPKSAPGSPKMAPAGAQGPKIATQVLTGC